MGLKDKTSLYDLVPGPNVPVGNFEEASGGPSFDKGQSSTLQQDSLLNEYLYTHGGVAGVAGPVPLPGHFADLDGLPGPSFDLGQNSTLQPDSLLNTYNYQYGNSPETTGPVPGGDSNSPYQDLNGLEGPSFENGPNSTLQQDSLLNAYNYQYGNSSADILNGNPAGGAQDLNGGLPTNGEYINNLPD